MSETEVTKLTKKLISEGKLEYINYGADLSYKLTVSKIGRINFSYIDDKLSKLTIHFYGTTKEELCAIIHQELCNKQYSYYKDHLLSRIYYIKHNIIITLSYEEIKSNISGVPNTKITTMEYSNAKIQKTVYTNTKLNEQDNLIGNPRDF